MTRPVIFTDPFTGAEDTNILGYNGWGGPNGSGFMKIKSNKAQNTWAGTGDVYHTRQVVGSNDNVQLYAEITRPTVGNIIGGNAGIRIAGRCVSAAVIGARVLAGLEPTSPTTAKLWVHRRDSGDTTQQASSVVGISWSDGQTLRMLLTLDGANVTASLEPSGGGATIATCTIVVTDLLSGQDFVRMEYTTGNVSNLTYDDFTVLGPEAAPTVDSITPNKSNVAGGISAVVAGANFNAAATVSIGGNAATVVAVALDGTTIDIIVPAGTVGLHDVVVTNPGSQFDTLVDGFGYYVYTCIGNPADPVYACVVDPSPYL